jgi:quercetin dioxygenase-like cupin family protein
MNRNDFIKLTAAVGTAIISAPQSLLAGTKRIIIGLNPKIVRNNEGKVVNVIGDKQTFKLTGKDTNGLFTLIEEENDPGTGIPPHVHEKEDEVFKVLEGEMELTVGDTTTILKAGDLAFGPRGIPHSWKIVGNSKAKVILSVFPAGIEDMFEELGTMPLGPPDFPKVVEICDRYGVKFIQ